MNYSVMCYQKTNRVVNTQNFYDRKNAMAFVEENAKNYKRMLVINNQKNLVIHEKVVRGWGKK